MLHEKDVPHVLTINLSNPAALPARIEVRNKLIDDASNQRLEGLVPSILLRIPNTLAMDDPSHIANPMRPQNVGQTPPIRLGKNPLHRPHAIDKLHTSRRRKASQHVLRLLPIMSIDVFQCSSASPR